LGVAPRRLRDRDLDRDPDRDPDLDRDPHTTCDGPETAALVLSIVVLAV